MSNSAATILCGKLSWLSVFQVPLLVRLGQRRLRRKSGQVIIAPSRSVRAGGPNGDNVPKQRSRKEPSFLSRTESRE